MDVPATQAITPQLPGLAAAGFDVRCLYMPVTDRSSWAGLTDQAVALLRELLASSPHDQVCALTQRHATGWAVPVLQACLQGESSGFVLSQPHVAG